MTCAVLASKTRGELSELNTLQARKRTFSSTYRPDYGFSGTVVNLVCPSLNEGSLKIMMKVPETRVYWNILFSIVRSNPED